jgi:murein peptide amidase A
MREDYLARHRAHDYAYLVERWRAVAKRAGLVMRRLAMAGELPLYTVRSPRLPREGTIYISAGIHGDEPAGTEGLITWAERNTRLLKQRPFLLVPCINPWGLVNNSRTDAERRDLNRAFQDDGVAEIAALRRVIGARKYSLGLTLHEDYDAVGIYIYEIRGAEPYWGEGLLEVAREYVPADGRGMIEGREAEGGIVRPVLDMKIFETMGLPEAVYLRVQGCERVFTIETPSEYGLDRRAGAHVAVIGECVRRVGKYLKRS